MCEANLNLVERIEAKMGRTNCWQFKNCGREPGGKKASELGICPAASETRLNTINSGKNGGRAGGFGFYF
jgi:hypothetical protein